MSVFSTSGGGMSKRDAAHFHKDVRQGLKDAARKAYTAKLAELNAELEKVKAQGRAKVAGQRTRCAEEVKETRGKARAVAKEEAADCRESLRAEMRERGRACSIGPRSAARAKVEEKKGACVVEGRELRAQVRTEAQIVADKLQAEKEFKAELARIEAGNRKREQERSTVKRGESVAEKIDALQGEIERAAPHLLPYWRKLRNKAALVQEAGRASAFERFMHRAAEDSEAGAAEEDEAAEFVRGLQRQQHAGGRTHARTSKVPF